MVLNQKRVCVPRLASQQWVTSTAKENNLFSKQHFVGKTLVLDESAMVFSKDLRWAVFTAFHKQLEN